MIKKRSALDRIKDRASNEIDPIYTVAIYVISKVNNGTKVFITKKEVNGVHLKLDDIIDAFLSKEQAIEISGIRGMIVAEIFVADAYKKVNDFIDEMRKKHER